MEQLRAGGVRDVGMLFVVGEERGSDGAEVANTQAPETCRFLINGEPTDNRLGIATRGVYRVRLHAHGRAAHSSYPELGESATEKLIDALVRLRTLPWPTDPDMGTTHYNIGLLSGGVAPNVTPPHAVAEVLFRTVAATQAVRDVLSALVPAVTIEEVLESEPVRMHTVPGFDTAAFPYMTDIALLPRWGKPLLLRAGFDPRRPHRRRVHRGRSSRARRRRLRGPGANAARLISPPQRPSGAHSRTRPHAVSR